MSWFPFLLVVFSAFCHAGWNFIGKKSVPYLSFFTVVSGCSTLLLLPFALNYGSISGLLIDQYLPWLIATGFFQGCYFIGLSGGYRGYELSVVYPLARALPVAVVPVVVSLFNDRHYEVVQYLGVALIISGCLLVPFRSKDVFWASLLSKGVMYACIAALATTGYSYIDQHVLTEVAKTLPEKATWQRSLVYMFWLSLFATCWVSLFSVFGQKSIEQWRITVSSQITTAMAAGAVMTLTYSLVLVAMNYVSHVGYVVALRQLSIPIGVAMGIMLLGESFNRLKLAGLVAVMLGILLVVGR